MRVILKNVKFYCNKVYNCCCTMTDVVTTESGELLTSSSPQTSHHETEQTISQEKRLAVTPYSSPLQTQAISLPSFSTLKC